MQRVKSVWAIILLMMVGCGGSSKLGGESDTFITVDVSASYLKKELILQDFIDVEYIPLETSKEFLCQGVVQAIGNDFIIVRNRVRDGDIFIFDRKGKGLRKINRMGRGPEEYSAFTAIILDENNNEMFVHDASIRTMLVYDLYGNFRRRIKYEESDRVTFTNYGDFEKL